VDPVAGVTVPAVSSLKLCYHSTMKWFQWTPDRNGIVGAIVATIIAVTIFAFLVTYFPNFQQRTAGAGFGPDWECTAQPKGDPICIKKPGR
jgi:hypothetical protein